MPYLILAVAVVIGLYLLVRGIQGADPKAVLRIFKWTGAIIGIGVAVYLIVTGRLGFAAAVVAGLLPLLLRARRIAQMARSLGGPSPGQSSDVETAYLRMSLDHDTGQLNGTVLQGPFRGRLIEELSLEELLALLRDCRVNDEESAALIESYLDRVHGAEWRGGDGGPGGAHGDARGGARDAAGAPEGRPMTVDEAYEILGVRRGADADEIRDAHRRLMLKIHPDQGGSTYLAAKINQAKEVLLGS